MLDFNKAKVTVVMSRRFAWTQQDCPGFGLHAKERFVLETNGKARF